MKELGEHEEKIKKGYILTNTNFYKGHFDRIDSHYENGGAVAIDKDRNMASAVPPGWQALKISGRTGTQ